MTISAQTPTSSYTGDALTLDFVGTFTIAATTEVLVYLDSVLQTTGYTVSVYGISHTTCTVSFIVAPGVGVVVRLDRATPFTQSTVLTVGAAFDSASTEKTYDTLERQIQDVNYKSLKLSPGTSNYNANSTRIINLATPTATTDAVTKAYVDAYLPAAAATAAAAAALVSETNAAASETAAALSYDNFDDRYLGQKAADPTLDNDGNALLVGALYFNNVSNNMKVYSGASWIIFAANTILSDGTVPLTADWDVGAHTISSLQVLAGEMGTEDGTILIDGVSYGAHFKTSDINDSHIAHMLVHRHSTTIEPIFVTSRSHSTGNTHAIVQNSDGLGSWYAVGHDGTDYAFGGKAGFYVDGTPGSNDMPTKFVLQLSQDGTQNLNTVLTLNANASATFNGTINPVSGTTTIAPILMTSGNVLTTPTAGVMEYDGNCFYTTPVASSRGVALTEYFVVNSADRTGANSNTAQPWFVTTLANGAVTLSSLTSYFFEGHLFVSTTGTFNHSIAIGFGGTATLTSIGYNMDSYRNATSFATITPVSEAHAYFATAASQIVSSAAAPTYDIILISGIVRINAGGTFIPQFTFNNPPGVAPTIAAGTYFKLTPIGTNTVTNVGNWS